MWSIYAIPCHAMPWNAIILFSVSHFFHLAFNSSWWCGSVWCESTFSCMFFGANTLNFTISMKLYCIHLLTSYFLSFVVDTVHTTFKCFVSIFNSIGFCFCYASYCIIVLFFLCFLSTWTFSLAFSLVVYDCHKWHQVWMLNKCIGGVSECVCMAEINWNHIRTRWK